MNKSSSSYNFTSTLGVASGRVARVSKHFNKSDFLPKRIKLFSAKASVP